MAWLIKRSDHPEINLTDGIFRTSVVDPGVWNEWRAILSVPDPGYVVVSGKLWDSLILTEPPPLPPSPLPVPPTPVPAGGGRPFSGTSMWNTPTPGATAWFDTAVLHNVAAGAGGVRHWWVNTSSAVVWYGHPSDPVWTFTLPNYIDVVSHRNRPAQTFQRRAPANMLDGGDIDHILVLVDIATGNYIEVWNANVDQANKTVTYFAGGPGWALGDFINGPGGGTLANNDGVRAANFSWAGGLITGHDFTAGKIDHALAIALPYDMLKSGGGTYRAPATCGDFGSGHIGPIWMGSRIGVPAATAKPGGLSSIGSMVFDALKTYGAFVGDFCGGNWPMFYVEKNTVTEAQVHQLYAYWDYGGSGDMEKIGLLLRVADYQP